MRIIPALLLLTVGSAISWGKDPPKKESTNGLSWARTDSALTLMRGDEIVWRFNHGTDQSKPFFHPINLPGATTLTWDAPPDHPWHHGLWFSWKLINGVNYWEEDRKTHKSAGHTTWDDVSIKQNDDHSARIEMDLVYRPPGKPPVLAEHRVVTISAPRPDGGYQIDWTATFTAQAKKVVLDRTPLPNEPNGKYYGGYAGLSVRLAKNAVGFSAVDCENQIKEQTQRTRIKAHAVDNAGAIGKMTGGIAIIDHGKNLNSPSPWYIIRGNPMMYFSPAVIHDAPHTFSAGEAFTLRYRILVHPGRFDSATLKEHSNRFSKSPLR